MARVTLNLTPRAAAALDAAARTGDNRTDVINRALVVYEVVLELMDRGDGRSLVVRSTDGELERIYVL